MQVEIDGKSHEVAPCPFCGGKPTFVERAMDAFGFRCTCGGKRHVHTYYNPQIDDRTGRIESAVAAWNCRPPVAVEYPLDSGPSDPDSIGRSDAAAPQG